MKIKRCLTCNKEFIIENSHNTTQNFVQKNVGLLENRQNKFYS